METHLQKAATRMTNMQVYTCSWLPHACVYSTGLVVVRLMSCPGWTVSVQLLLSSTVVNTCMWVYSTLQNSKSHHASQALGGANIHTCIHTRLSHLHVHVPSTCTYSIYTYQHSLYIKHNCTYLHLTYHPQPQAAVTPR